MEMESGRRGDDRKAGDGWWWVKGVPKKLKEKMVEVARNTKEVGQDDPRRIIHSLKVGLALTFVSLIYYFHPLYQNFGVSAMWAVLTVVVVFEFSVGATLGKGFNRGVATLLAGALGVGAHHLASLSGNIAHPILLGLFVFLQATAATFVRFIPEVKAKYDYGLLVFILTFCMVSVSGLRNDEILDLAYKRLSTVFMGASACVIVSILVCPVWAGEDLHNLVALNIERLGNFLEGFGDEYLRTSEDEELKDDKSFLQAYRNVLNSKCSEETLANFARWEPGHGRFMYHHPWKQYLIIGTLTRQCAYRIELLSGYLNVPESQAVAPPEIREKIQDTCTKLSLESGKALKELALAVKTMTHPSSADPHVTNSRNSAQNLELLLKSGLWEDTDLLKVIPVATVASLLIDVVICVEKIAESIHELASLAHFKTIDMTVSPENPMSDQLRTAKSHTDTDSHHHVITVDNSDSAFKENGNPQFPVSSRCGYPGTNQL
ncbi:aluminum-activated malate transporter 2-like [Cornus florida]|uniref:aluminum-activated malate transporter 2-like n=1 Tax=Cornus florida TaxID=4283 RepID=UPI00289E2453|nr:aluminum-activated malate transporter 2-like [Cornus florida]